MNPKVKVLFIVLSIILLITLPLFIYINFIDKDVNYSDVVVDTVEIAPNLQEQIDKELPKFLGEGVEYQYDVETINYIKDYVPIQIIYYETNGIKTVSYYGYVYMTQDIESLETELDLDKIQSEMDKLVESDDAPSDSLAYLGSYTNAHFIINFIFDENDKLVRVDFK